MDSYAAVDLKLQEMEKHLRGIYERASEEVGASWKSYVRGIVDEIKPLEQELELAQRNGDEKQVNILRRKIKGKERDLTLANNYYKRQTEQLARELTQVNKTAAAYINGELPQAYMMGYNGFVLNMNELNLGISFNLVDEQTVRSLATDDATLLPYKYVDGVKMERWNTQMVNSEVLQGILQGEPMDVVAKRLSAVLSMNEVSAIRNARTAVTGAENRGRIEMLKAAEKKGLHNLKVWSAIHDTRTREAHSELDGQVIEIDESWENDYGEIRFPGDPEADPANVYNCRCRLKYVFKGYTRPEA